MISKRDAARWIGRFEAARAMEAELLAADGPRPEWSIALSLSMIAAAERLGVLTERAGELRRGEDEAVRRTWARLRARLS